MPISKGQRGGGGSGGGGGGGSSTPTTFTVFRANIATASYVAALETVNPGDSVILNRFDGPEPVTATLRYQQIRNSGLPGQSRVDLWLDQIDLSDFQVAGTTILRNALSQAIGLGLTYASSGDDIDSANQFFIEDETLGAETLALLEDEFREQPASWAMRANTDPIPTDKLTNDADVFTFLIDTDDASAYDGLTIGQDLWVTDGNGDNFSQTTLLFIRRSGATVTMSVASFPNLSLLLGAGDIEWFLDADQLNSLIYLGNQVSALADVATPEDDFHVEEGREFSALNEARRIDGLIPTAPETWAEDGNADPIPAAKLTNAPGVPEVDILTFWVADGQFSNFDGLTIGGNARILNNIGDVASAQLVEIRAAYRTGNVGTLILVTGATITGGYYIGTPSAVIEILGASQVSSAADVSADMQWHLVTAREAAGIQVYEELEDVREVAVAKADLPTLIHEFAWTGSQTALTDMDDAYGEAEYLRIEGWCGPNSNNRFAFSTSVKRDEIPSNTTGTPMMFISSLRGGGQVNPRLLISLQADGTLTLNPQNVHSQDGEVRVWGSATP